MNSNAKKVEKIISFFPKQILFVLASETFLFVLFIDSSNAWGTFLIIYGMYKWNMAIKIAIFVYMPFAHMFQKLKTNKLHGICLP